MSKILLIVDPQNDFINRALPVPNAEEKMRNLAKYIQDSDYDAICITLDSHPKNHCSFKDNGGIWPPHCVFESGLRNEFLQYTANSGWDLPYYLLDVLDKKQVLYYHKGTWKNKEEYSIFDNQEDGTILKGFLLDVEHIDICGIAGDYCVLETLKGLISFNQNVCVLKDYTPSIDGGEKLNNFIKENNICSK